MRGVWRVGQTAKHGPKINQIHTNQCKKRICSERRRKGFYVIFNGVAANLVQHYSCLKKGCGQKLDVFVCIRHHQIPEQLDNTIDVHIFYRVWFTAVRMINLVHERTSWKDRCNYGTNDLTCKTEICFQHVPSGSCTCRNEGISFGGNGLKPKQVWTWNSV